MRPTNADSTIGLSLAYAVGVVCLLGLLQLLAFSLTSVALSGWMGAGSGLLAFGLWQLRETPQPKGWESALLLVATGLGIWLGQAALHIPVEKTVWGILTGIGVTGVLVFFRHLRQSPQCRICAQALGRTEHTCPRCGHTVCGRVTCWQSSDCRCADCELLGRPLLLLEDEAWWRTRLRERLTTGRCSRCGKAASPAVDLRKCRQCPRTMCTQCWDWENGVCVKCRWVIPDLPAALQQCQAEASTARATGPGASQRRTSLRSRRDDAEIRDEL